MKKHETKYLTASSPKFGLSRINLEKSLGQIELKNLTKLLTEDLKDLLDKCAEDKSIKVIKFTSLQLNKPYIRKLILELGKEYGEVKEYKEGKTALLVNRFTFLLVRAFTLTKVPALPKRYKKKLYSIEIKMR